MTSTAAPEERHRRAPGGPPVSARAPRDRPPTSLRRRTSVVLAWLASTSGAVVFALAGATEPDVAWVLVFAALGADVIVFATVGAILALRQPRNLVGLVLLASGLLVVVTFSGFMFGARLTELRGPGDLAAGLASLAGGLTIFATLIVAGPTLALVFPDGELPGRAWRWPVAAIAGAVVLGTIMAIPRPGPVNTGLADNPFGVPGTTWAEPVSSVGAALAAFALPSALLLAVASVVVRYQRAARGEREQLKWFLAANACVVVLVMLSLLDGATHPTPFDLLAILSLALPPIAVGIAILRYRLYEIDRLISRTLAYGLVTAVLVAVLAAGNLALQTALAGITQGGTVAVAASTLVAFALFQPLRRRIQSAVDRRFDRARIDADRTVSEFAERLRGELDLASVTGDLRATAHAAVRPLAAAVWLRGGKGRR